MNRQLPINILRGDPINYYSINFHQHKHFYDFFQEGVVDDFLNSVYERFLSDGQYKIQGYVEIINYQPTEIINLKNTRVWLTNLCAACHFISYVRNEIRNNILK